MACNAFIRRPAVEAQGLLDELYSAGDPSPGSALDQCGLRDGLQIVDDYLMNGEAGVAFEHLLYMISETSLKLSATSLADLHSAAEILGMAQDLKRCLKEGSTEL